MILWNARKLASEFRADAVSEREQFSYVLLYTLLTYIFSDTYLMDLISIGNPNELDALISALSLIVVGAGTYRCYRTSQRNPAKNGFVPRFICLGLPVMIRVIVFVLGIGVALMLISLFLIPMPPLERYFEAESTTIIDVVLVVSAELAYFAYLNQMIRESYT